MDFWKRGERAKVARLCNISNSFLGDILYRRRVPSVEMAARLAGASHVVRSENEGATGVPFGAFCHNQWTNHPAFFGQPK